MEHGIVNDIALCIIVAWLLGLLGQILRQPLILAYLVAGFAVGPIGLGMIRENSIADISAMGLVFLLFMIGLEIDLKKMWNAGRAIAITAGTQIVGGCILGVVAFYLLGFPLGNGHLDALYLGVATALSSTVIIVKILYDKRELDTLAGRITLGVLVLQDLFAILFLALQPSLKQPEVALLAFAFAKALLLVAAAFLASRFVLPHIFRAVSRLPEMVLVGALAWCFTVSGVAGWLGLSREMGALIAGVAISTFPYALDVTAKVTTLRDFFVTLFFVSLGVTIPAPTPYLLWWAGLICAFVVVSRFVTVFPLLYGMGYGHRMSLLPALNLAQISEFSLVILALGSLPEFQHVAPETKGIVAYAFAILAVFSTYVLPKSDQVLRRCSPWLARLGFRDLYREAEPSDGHGQPARVFLLGFYWTASSLLAELERQCPTVLSELAVIDFNPKVNETLRARGVRVVYGDISQRETLLHAGITGAELIVCTIPNSVLKGTTNLRLLRQVRELNPAAQIIVHAEQLGEVHELYAAGANYVSLPRLTEASELCAVLTAARDQLLEEKRAAQERQLDGRREVLS